ncbi:dienelactone hydrolase family protein [Dactylosporangium sp. NPDC051484]|uniref:dienelactone hydrolase family protein n=1 Tax=Dactylosporangium sp. NPDC051484 TaxID=3154942 RepID=UPI00344BCA14
MSTQHISYTVDGQQYVGYLAVGGGPGRRPAVLVCHTGTGLGPHTRHVTERLADIGYVAFALDLYGNGAPIEVQQVDSKIQSLKADAPRLQRIAEAGLSVLLARPETDVNRVAAIGYCFGGSVALELARSGANLRAVAAFHAGLSRISQVAPKKISASVLAMVGGSDPHLSVHERTTFEQEMDEAGADWRMTIYGGAEHGFTNPESSTRGISGLSYSAQADERSWREMLDLFGEVLDG